MFQNSKATPKSCGCRQCTFSKGTKPCGNRMKAEERAFRHRSNQQTRTGLDADILPAGSRSRQA